MWMNVESGMKFKLVFRELAEGKGVQFKVAVFVHWSAFFWNI